MCHFLGDNLFQFSLLNILSHIPSFIEIDKSTIHPFLYFIVSPQIPQTINQTDAITRQLIIQTSLPEER